MSDAARNKEGVIQPLIIDIYPDDRHLDCVEFTRAGEPWHGIIAKASQGTRYRYVDWLVDIVRRFRAAAGNGYGVEQFDGFYAFLNLSEPGTPQVDTALEVVAAAGGESIGTLPLMLDVERGGQAHPDTISRAQVEDVTRSAAARYHQLTGREATLYGGELLRSCGATDRLGCARSAVALYGPRLGRQLESHTETTAEFLAATGTDLEHLMLWQYVAADGAPTTPPPGYPVVAPGIGRVDINAVVLPGGIEALRTLCGRGA
jgi:hypothetical protein